MSSLDWVFGLLIIAAVFFLLHRMERLVGERGSIFRGTRPGEYYSFPLLLGLLVLGFSAVCWLAGVHLFTFVVAGVALVGCGVGNVRLLHRLEGESFFPSLEVGTRVPKGEVTRDDA